MRLYDWLRPLRMVEEIPLIGREPRTYAKVLSKPMRRGSTITIDTTGSHAYVYERVWRWQ